MRTLPWMGISFLTLALGCSDGRPAPAPVAQAAAPAPASIATDAASEFQVTGPIVVENQVDVAAERDGVVARLYVDIGTPVRKGQVLGELDDRQLAAEKEAADAKMKSIAADVKNWEAETKVQESDLSRAREMMKADLITKQELDHAQYKVTASEFEVERERHNLQNAQSTLRALELEQEKMRVVAPFDGVVARRYVRVGQKITKDDKLFWVTATGPMTVRFALPERFIGKISKGAELVVTTADLPNEKHAAKVVMVSPVVDPASGTIEVGAQLIGSPGELRPGMTATVHVNP